MSGTNGLGADAQDRGLARCANPQVPVVQQKIHPVLLELNRVGSVVRNALHHFDRRDLNFKPARSALIGVNFPGDDDARFLRQAMKCFECCRLLLQRHDALNRSRAVAEDRKNEFSGFAQVVEPAAQCDFLSVVLTDILNGYYRHEMIFSRLKNKP